MKEGAATSDSSRMTDGEVDMNEAETTTGVTKDREIETLRRTEIVMETVVEAAMKETTVDATTVSQTPSLA